MTDQTLLMYDATPEGVQAIPGNAQAVAGYVDGHYVSFPALVKRFWPHAHCVSIGIFPGHTAAFTDVEPGNPINTPNMVRVDFEYRKAHGVWRLGFYADGTRMRDTILPGLAGIPASEYRLWLADWDGDLTDLPPAIDAAKQARSYRLYDVSVVDIPRFFPAPPPVHHPPIIHKPPLPIHPKVTAATATAALVTGIEATVHALTGAKITPAEASGITAFAAFLGGYLFPAKR